MKHAAVLFLSLFVAGTVTAQSLADLASKEKKRREQTQASGKTAREYTDVGGIREKPDDEPDQFGALGEAKEPSAKKPGPEETIEWKGIYGHYRVSYLHLENKMKMLDGRAEKWCGLPPHEPDPKKFAAQSTKYKSKCQEIKDDKKELRAEMRTMQSECLTEAKRHGVSPGSARLGKN